MRVKTRLVLGFGILFVAFAAFTAFAPCKYASLRAVERQLGLVASAAAGGPDECECSPASIFEPVGGPCRQECSIVLEYGCGLLWVIPCDKMYVQQVSAANKQQPNPLTGQPVSAPTPTTADASQPVQRKDVAAADDNTSHAK